MEKLNSLEQLNENELNAIDGGIIILGGAAVVGIGIHTVVKGIAAKSLAKGLVGGAQILGGSATIISATRN